MRWIDMLRHMLGLGQQHVRRELTEVTTALADARLQQARAVDSTAYALEDLLKANDRLRESRYRRH